MSFSFLAHHCNILVLVSAKCLSSYVKVFYVMDKVLTGALSCMGTGLVASLLNGVSLYRKEFALFEANSLTLRANLHFWKGTISFLQQLTFILKGLCHRGNKLEVRKGISHIESGGKTCVHIHFKSPFVHVYPLKL